MPGREILELLQFTRSPFDEESGPPVRRDEEHFDFMIRFS